MPILLTRIDDRLIHGQVVVGWAQSLKANHIVVVNDEIVENDMQKFLFRMATPTDIKLSMLTIGEAADRIKKREFDDDDVILLAKTPADIVEMIKQGGKIPELNIGGMHFGKDACRLFPLQKEIVRPLHLRSQAKDLLHGFTENHTGH